MTRAFALAAAAMFADRNIAREAVFRAGGSGPDTPVRIILRRPDQVTGFGDGRYVTGALEVKVPATSVPQLVQGDVFETSDGVFEVRGAPRLDAHGLIWTGEARAL